MATPPTSVPALGLTAAHALRRLEEDGPNVLPVLRPPSPARQLLGQFVHFFALLLWAAGGLAIVGGMPELGVAIFAVIVINGLFAFAQEYRADRAAARLQALLPADVRVLRDGRPAAVHAADVVVGDVLLLAEGDRISADATVLDAESMQVDTSTLTGESVPDPVVAAGALHAGTFVVSGSGRAVVTATGGRTQLAAVADLTARAHRARTPLERDIARLARTVAIVATAAGAGFFALMLLLGVPASEGFLFGIGITVALVPEGLLPTVTLALAFGAQAMADEQALVRRLESVETLGATTFICTDKTGTLTQNRMNVVRVWTPVGAVRIEGQGYEPSATIGGLPGAVAAASRTAAAALAASRGRAVQDDDGEWTAHGDPMDAAVHALARRLGDHRIGEPEDAFERFDAVRRTASSVRGGQRYLKGAPESVLAACGKAPPGVASALQALAADGLRVLAVAAGPVEGPVHLLGLLGFADPPREGVAEALAACRTAGIKVAMITGDHPRTAGAVAREIGLALPGSPVLLAADLPQDPQALGATLDRDGLVLARAAPQDKLRIAHALQLRGHVVAMTGDGVNDAPALRTADIGVAMGRSGTDVAREAADIVLLDDHFGTIVSAVRQGRATFSNTRRFLTYHLTDNVAELAPFVVWALSGGRFPLALGVLQILALDLGTDTLPATALAAERPRASMLARPPIRGRLLDRTVGLRAFGVLGPLEAGTELAVFVVALAAAGWRPGAAFPTGPALAAASGAAFATVVVMQLANAFACRSTRSPAWRLGWGTNRFLVWAVVAAGLFGAACLWVPGAAAVLGQARPPAAVLPLLAAAPALLLLVDAGWKLLVARPNPRPSPDRCAAPR